jgi:hypothetical protein
MESLDERDHLATRWVGNNSRKPCINSPAKLTAVRTARGPRRAEKVRDLRQPATESADAAPE